jgi:hypothetical protein
MILLLIRTAAKNSFFRLLGWDHTSRDCSMATLQLSSAMDQLGAERLTHSKEKPQAAGVTASNQETQDFFADSNRGIAPRALGVLFEELEQSAANNPNLHYRIK